MSALLDLEQLPDWKHVTLMAWILQAPTPPGCDAGSLLTLREMQLVGRLALCVEQALALEDEKTAKQVLQLACQTWVRIRGEQALYQALDAIGPSTGLDVDVES